MKRLNSIKLFLVFCSIFHLSLNSFSQECIVEKESLKGTYTGDCKRGKAQGIGKAIGKETYEGEFKAGYPEGQGTYTWSNGNTFTGHFLKGFCDGKGILKYKRTNASDSIVEGFWKKDVYIGKFENPYTIYFKSKMVNEIEVEYKNDGFNKATFYITNTSGGGTNLNSEYSKLKVDEVQLSSGSYGTLTVSPDFSKKTESIISEIKFPTRMKVIIGSEEIEIEFHIAGSYNVNVHINY